MLVPRGFEGPASSPYAQGRAKLGPEALRVKGAQHIGLGIALAGRYTCWKKRRLALLKGHKAVSTICVFFFVIVKEHMAYVNF